MCPGERKQYGFSLIEVLTVLVMFALLAAIAYPSYVESIRKAKRAEARAALMQLMQQQERFYTQNNSYIKFSFASTDEQEKKFKWFSGNDPKASAYEIRGEACNDDTIWNCVMLSAKPGTNNVDPNYKDPVCGELTLTSTGIKSADGSDCWE